MLVQYQVQFSHVYSKTTGGHIHQKYGGTHARNHSYEIHTPVSAAHAQSNSPPALSNLDGASEKCLKLAP